MIVALIWMLVNGIRRAVAQVQVIVAIARTTTPCHHLTEMRSWCTILTMALPLACDGQAAPVTELPWSFAPLSEQTLPAVEQSTWPHSRIDHFVLARIEANGFHPARPAGDRVLLRRLYFDLIGLPPLPGQLAAFQRRAADDRQAAIASEIDTLLASPHYGERWARHWLDLARYTDKTATWLDSTAAAWRYRDWVVGALNRDLRYDTFVKQQLANDLIDGGDPSDNAALGFLGLSPTYWKELQLSPEIIKTTVADEWEERMDALGRTFLGLTLACARCHDHKFEPVTQADYYAIAGVFASVRIADRPMVDEKLWAPVVAARAEVSKLEKQLAALKKKTKPGSANRNVAGVRAPAFSRDYADAIAALKPLLHAPLNADPQPLIVEAGVEISPDKFAAFTAGRLRGESESLADHYSVAFWFRNDLPNRSRPVTGYLFSRGPDGGARAPGDHLGIGGTAAQQAAGTLFLYNGDVAKETLAGSTVIAPGTWNHVVLARAGKRVSAWLNGATRPEFAGAIEATAADSKAFFLGGRNERFALVNGRMAHLAFFDRAITADEARQLHAAAGQAPGSITGPPEENSAPPAAKSDPEVEIAKLEIQIAAIKKATPHYDVPMVNGVSEAALFVNPAKGKKHGTSLDFTADKARDLPIHKRGNPNNPGETVPRRFLDAFPATTGKTRKFERGSGRLDLAEAIVSEAAPLSARVIVNRVWQHHFGRGLVATPSELGHSGEAPSHPTLLDDLAARFVKNGWSLHWLHREILQSATWQQSIDNPTAQEADPANQYLARMERRRLDVETWRDSMLHASGQLDPRRGGAPQDLGAEDNRRRTLYGIIHRREPNQFLRVHDFPDPTAHAATRPQTITPLQQLFTLNGPLIQSQAAALAAKLMGENGTRARVIAAYQKLFQRDPSGTELEIATSFLTGTENDSAAWTQYAHALLASNEFQFIE